jgi:hypothetical protein
MEAMMRDVKPFQKQTKAVLIRSDRYLLVLTHDKRGVSFFLLFSQKWKYLFGNRNDPARGQCFRCLSNPAILSICFTVVTGFAYGQFTFRKVNVIPLQCKQFSNTKSRVKAEENTKHLWTLIREDCVLNFLLFYR